MNIVEKFFGLSKTDIKTEILAGLTTFCTFSYIIIVVPKLLEQAGLPYGAAFTAVMLLAGFANLFAGLFSNLPFAIAPLLSDSAFIAYILVPGMGYSWQEISAAVLLSGIVLFIMAITKFRFNFLESLPSSIKLSFTAGLGFYLLLSGLKNGKVIDFSQNISSLKFGNLYDYHIIFLLLGVIFIFLLDKLKIKMSVLFSILILTLIGLIFGDMVFPNQPFIIPPSLSPVLFQFDFSNFFSLKFLTLFFLLFLMINTEVHGSIVSVMMNYKEQDSLKLKNCIQKFLYADSSSTVASSCFGIPTIGVYVDSITGIKAGGKSGLTVVTVGIMFLITLFLSPVFSIFPYYVYGAVLSYIGIVLLLSVKDAKYNDYTEYITFWIILGTIFYTLNIALGMTLGFVIYPLLKLTAKRFFEIPKEFFIFTIMAVIFFIVKIFNLV